MKEFFDENGKFDQVKFYARLREHGIIDHNDGDQDELHKKNSPTAELLNCANTIWDKYKNDITARSPQCPNGKVYSDRWDQSGRQVVDLVQEGGGMLGIALVGYTYILERAGLRPMSLAGTSAGGINTMMMAALPDRLYEHTGNPTKSEVLAHIIANTEFSRFIDRKGIISWIVARLLGRWWRYTLAALLATGPILAYLSYYMLYRLWAVCGLSYTELEVYKAWSVLCCLFFPAVLFIFLLMVVLGHHFGINPGAVFKSWVGDLLREMDVNDTRTLMTDNMKPVPLIDTPTSTNIRDQACRRLVLITSSVTFNRIVKLPERASDYWQEPGSVHPEEYVRATMSIPFFFEVYVPGTESGSRVTRPSRFVDGGMLSNFPIREFHSVNAPRYPTFGIKLGKDTDPKFQLRQSLMGYILSFFSTFKKFYDNDFINTDPETEKLIQNIDTGTANWLNFWMTQKEKQDLFARGAEAACEFLQSFDWVQYKDLRAKKPSASTCDPSTASSAILTSTTQTA